MKKSLAGLIVVAVGVAFIVTTFVANLYKAGPAFERMTTSFRPHMTQAAITQYQKDLSGLAAVNTEFTTKAAPALAQALHMTPAQFNAYVTKQFPAVAAGMAAMPQIGTSFKGVLTTLDNERARFASADAIPTSSLPATTLPWALLGIGVLAIGVGGWLMVGGRSAQVVAVVLAGLLILVPLALSLPSKAANADTMNAHLKPVYTEQLVAGAKGSLQVLQAMGTEMQTKMIPAVAQAMNLTTAQTQAFLASSFPAIAQGLQSMPAALTRFAGLVGAFDKSLADYNTLKPISLAPVVWVIVIGGFVTLVVAFAARTEERARIVGIKTSPAKAA
jgi:hypothetical protein